MEYSTGNASVSRPSAEREMQVALIILTTDENGALLTVHVEILCYYCSVRVTAPVDVKSTG